MKPHILALIGLKIWKQHGKIYNNAGLGQHFVRQDRADLNLKFSQSTRPGDFKLFS